MTVGTVLRRLETDLGELLAKHDRARDLSEFTRYRDDPVAFIREVLRGQPWSRQVEIAEAVRDNPLTVVRSCNGAGKDWLAARLALWWVYAWQGLALITGPTERQVREIVMREVARAWSRAADLPGELFQQALRLGRTEQAGILAFTSSEASRLTGFHAPRVMAVLTEAQGVEDFAWEGVLACATGPEDRVVAVGNPLSPTGRFHTVSRPQSDWKAISISAEEHPNVVEGRDVIPGGVSRPFISRMASEYGIGSGIYRSRVLGEFPDEGEQGLIRRSWLEEASRKHESNELGRFAEDDPAVVAIDPARYGPDFTAVALVKGPVLEELVLLGRNDLMTTTGLLIEQFRHWGVGRARPEVSFETLAKYPFAPDLGPHRGFVVVDEVGLGAAVLDRLAEQGWDVDGFNGGRAASTLDDRDKFANLRAEAFWLMRRLLEEGEIALPHNDQLWDELIAIQWRPNSAGRIQIEAKDDIRNRLGRSPDRADAVAMAFWRWQQMVDDRGEYDPQQWQTLKM